MDEVWETNKQKYIYSKSEDPYSLLSLARRSGGSGTGEHRYNIEQRQIPFHVKNSWKICLLSS